jgi:hypothetical protein
MDNMLTSTKGSCGVDHGPKSPSNDKWLESSIADWLEIPENKLELSWLAMPSTLDKQRLRVLTMCGGGTDLAEIRARKGSYGFTGVLQGIAQSLV